MLDTQYERATAHLTPLPMQTRIYILLDAEVSPIAVIAGTSLDDAYEKGVALLPAVRSARRRISGEDISGLPVLEAQY